MDTTCAQGKSWRHSLAVGHCLVGLFCFVTIVAGASFDRGRFSGHRGPRVVCRYILLKPFLGTSLAPRSDWVSCEGGYCVESFAWTDPDDARVATLFQTDFGLIPAFALVDDLNEADGSGGDDEDGNTDPRRLRRDASTCVDRSHWRTEFNFDDTIVIDCAFFENQNAIVCNERETLDELFMTGTDGLRADEACCVCGGGISGGGDIDDFASGDDGSASSDEDTVTASPSPSPIAAPRTAEPTTSEPTIPAPRTSEPSTLEPTQAPTPAPSTSEPTTSEPTTSEPSALPTSVPSVSPCSASPCHNGGTCLVTFVSSSGDDADLYGSGLNDAPGIGFNCLCADGYFGMRCAETSAPSSWPTGVPTTSEPATSEPTTSEPTTSQPTTSQPITTEPTALPTSVPSVSPCSRSPCRNGGTCLVMFAGSSGDIPDPDESGSGDEPGIGFSCLCAPGYFGVQCEETVSPSGSPTGVPTTMDPTLSPTTEPTTQPTTQPTTSEPTTSIPTTLPTRSPTLAPTTSEPTTSQPTTTEPTALPTSVPSVSPCSRSPCRNGGTCLVMFAGSSGDIPDPDESGSGDEPGIGFSCLCAPGYFGVQCEETVSPSGSPTGVPTTMDPTLSPTTEPTTQPTTQPTTSEPTTSIPTTLPTRSPTLAPTTSEPTTSEPTTTEPTTSEPTTSEPTTSEPTTAEPTTSEPSPTQTAEPTTSEPTTSEPTAFPTAFPTTNPTVTLYSVQRYATGCYAFSELGLCDTPLALPPLSMCSQTCGPKSVDGRDSAQLVLDFVNNFVCCDGDGCSLPVATSDGDALSTISASTVAAIAEPTDPVAPPQPPASTVAASQRYCTCDNVGALRHCEGLACFLLVPFGEPTGNSHERICTRDQCPCFCNEGCDDPASFYFPCCLDYAPGFERDNFETCNPTVAPTPVPTTTSPTLFPTTELSLQPSAAPTAPTPSPTIAPSGSPTQTPERFQCGMLASDATGFTNPSLPPCERLAGLFNPAGTVYQMACGASGQPVQSVDPSCAIYDRTGSCRMCGNYTFNLAGACVAQCPHAHFSVGSGDANGGSATRQGSVCLPHHTGTLCSDDSDGDVICNAKKREIFARVLADGSFRGTTAKCSLSELHNHNGTWRLICKECAADAFKVTSASTPFDTVEVPADCRSALTCAADKTGEHQFSFVDGGLATLFVDGHTSKCNCRFNKAGVVQSHCSRCYHRKLDNEGGRYSAQVHSSYFFEPSAASGMAASWRECTQCRSTGGRQSFWYLLAGECVAADQCDDGRLPALVAYNRTASGWRNVCEAPFRCSIDADGAGNKTALFPDRPLVHPDGDCKCNVASGCTGGGTQCNFFTSDTVSCGAGAARGSAETSDVAPQPELSGGGAASDSQATATPASEVAVWLGLAVAVAFVVALLAAVRYHRRSAGSSTVGVRPQFKS